MGVRPLFTYDSYCIIPDIFLSLLLPLILYLNPDRLHKLSKPMPGAICHNFVDGNSGFHVSTDPVKGAFKDTKPLLCVTQFYFWCRIY